jgi:hypothetical protein
MLTQSIITIVAIIILALVALKIMKSVMKAVFVFTGLLILAGAVFGYVLYQDVNDFRQNFQSKPSLYILEKDSKAIAAVEGIISEKNILVKEDRFSEIKTAALSKDYKKILGNDYRIFIMQDTAFYKTVNLTIDGSEISTEEAITALSSDIPINTFITYSGKKTTKEKVMENLNVDDESGFRSKAFLALLDSAAGEDRTGFLVAGLKNKNIEVYPNTILFSVAKSLPANFLNSFIKVG